MTVDAEENEEGKKKEKRKILFGSGKLKFTF